MRQILWFRRDLRIEDSALLALAKEHVLPIFIFDKNILDKLDKQDKRVGFIYESVLNLKAQLKSLGLDLAIFYDEPKAVFLKLKKEGYDEVLCSVDYDAYAQQRDKDIESILPMQRFLDSFLLHPREHLKKDGTPYKMFTPFFKALHPLWESRHIQTYGANTRVKKCAYDYSFVPSLQTLGFRKQNLVEFLSQSAWEVLETFKEKIHEYDTNRDYFYKNGTSNLSVYLRFGLISPRQIFNEIKKLPNSNGVNTFIKELFWREFYNYCLYHFPHTEYENFNGLALKWEENEAVFQKWCNAQTGVPIIDAAMTCLNQTGTMPNRLRMLVASYATKNLLIPWKKAEGYFAQKLLDYEACSNIGSWQWAASTGVDSVPYFRLFNPYLQSKKFDKEGRFIKKYLLELKDVDAKYFHIEGALEENLFLDYPKPLVSIEFSRKRALAFYKNAKNGL